MVTRQGQRRPVRVRRRGVGDVLAGICALVALTALMVGVPVALLTLFDSPLPDSLPAASDLTDRVGPGALIGILVVLVWLAWLQLAACVVVEVYAGVRGVGVPARVPLSGGTQSLVHRLVVAALLLFSATSVIVPALSGGGGLSQRPPAQAQTVTQPQAQEFQQPPALGPAAAAPAAVADQAEKTTVAEPLIEQSATTKIYRVQPPEGRHHESLWEIAEKCLGEGRRYKEIFALNKNHIQPDGTRLTIASLIRPGWILEMPPDAKGAKVIPAKDLKDYFRYGHAVPDKPAKPVQPQKPEQPEQPEQPKKPEQPSEAAPAPPQATQPAPSQPPASQPPTSQPPASKAPAQQPTGPSGEMGGDADSGGASVPGQRADKADRGDQTDQGE
ncbi:MAG: LysM peptidoglycan-binding domain-containing protein, partial [Spirillospora sp.]